METLINHRLPSRPQAAEMAVVLYDYPWDYWKNICFEYALWKHAKTARGFGKISPRNTSRRLIANTQLHDESNGKLVCPMIHNKCPTLKPVGHQSTNWIVRLVLMLATAACTSLGTTSPRYNRQQATAKNNLSVICRQKTYDNSLYLPSLGSHFTIWLPFSKQEKVISATEFCSWPALSAERRGA